MSETTTTTIDAEAATPKGYSGIFGWMRRLRDWVEQLAEKPYALSALFLLAVAESIFFPIPVDVLLIALCVSIPKKSLKFALVATIGSVLGGLVGYGIGTYAWYVTGPDGTLAFSGIANFFLDTVPGFSIEAFDAVKELYDTHGFTAVFLAGFTPLPYKVVTISAGVFKINLGVFALASVLSRALRFFLVATLFYFFGKPIKKFIDKYLEILSVAFVVLLIGGFVAVKYLLH